MPAAYGKLYIKDANGTISQIIPEAYSINTEYVGATSNANGTAGLVPPAQSAQKGNYLRGDGSWSNVAFGDAVALSGNQIDPSLGNLFTKTITTNTTFSITKTNIPAGKTAMFTLMLTNGGSKTITWPSGMKWPGGTPPTLSVSGTDILTFVTPDGGTTWYGTISMAGVA